MTLRIVSPPELELDFPFAGAIAVRPPYAIARNEMATELAATIGERRAFNGRMVQRHRMTSAEAERDIAPLEDLARDLAAPTPAPRAEATHPWSVKLAELRRILLHRRGTWPARIAKGDIAEAYAARRLEALQALVWLMTIELAWCDAWSIDAPREQTRTTIRAWHWAIDERERLAADAGELWARPDRSTAARDAWRDARPDCADAFRLLDQSSLDAAIARGMASQEIAA